jgi:hypothetical protein
VEEEGIIFKENPQVYLYLKKGSEIEKASSVKNFCVKPWISPIVGVNGELTYCCSDYNFKFLPEGVKLKDFSYSIVKFWYGDLMQEVRDKFKEGIAPNPVCQECLQRGENLILEYV